MTPLTTALALDLGTTRIKAAERDRLGRLGGFLSAPAPELRGDGLVREADPETYLHAAEKVLADVRSGASDSIRVGIACQRSSFLLWERTTGRPVTPLISWQDRRAADWCRARGDVEDWIRSRTGLLLSPHYAGPKLAALFDDEAELRRRCERGELAFGTLETFLIWRWTNGQVHQTDPTQAARTLLFDLDRGEWAADLLEWFGVPRRALPEIAPSSGRSVPLQQGMTLCASLADQSAGALAALGGDANAVWVNSGTGTFVLRGTGVRPHRVPHYLAGPLVARAGAATSYALEGTINGGGPTADRFGPGPTLLPERDPTPDEFCSPDEAGLGAPHWRPEATLTFSRAAQGLEPSAKRRVVLEGILFRVREILEDLSVGGAVLGVGDARLRVGDPSTRIVLSGGLVNDPFFAAGLAACLGRPVELSQETEGTLLGAAELAARSSNERGGEAAVRAARGQLVEYAANGAYLRDKYARWREWMRNALTM